MRAWWLRAVSRGPLLAACSAAQFLVLAPVAMTLYGGGRLLDGHAPGYSFARNFFSDLGRTRAISGAGNTAAHALFAYSLACVGLAVILFGLAVGRFAQSAAAPPAARRLAPPAAFISGAGFIGIAAVPVDLSLATHLACVIVAFGFLLVFVTCLCVVEAAARARGWLIWPNVVYAALLAGYVGLLLAGPYPDTDGGLLTQVVAQKVIVYASIFNLGWQALALAPRARVEARVM